MSEEKIADGNTATTAVDSGTITKQENGRFNEETCIKMWAELNDANDGKVTNFHQLTDLCKKEH